MVSNRSVRTHRHPPSASDFEVRQVGRRPKMTSSTSQPPWTREARPESSSGRTSGLHRSEQQHGVRGGQLIATGRIPIQAILASIEADEATATEGG